VQGVKRWSALLCALLIAALPIGAASQPAPSMRIISLLPSLTEDLFALGAGTEVVGVSQYSDHPDAARAIPRVSSADSIDAEKILTLHPDLVVGIPSQAAMVAPLRRAHLHVVLLHDDTFDDIYATLHQLGALIGRPQAAAQLEQHMRAVTAQLLRGVSSGSRPSVFVVLDVTPIYTVGTKSYINTLIEMAGGRNAAKLGTAYARYSAETLLADQPDVLIVDPAVGFRSVEDREPWRSLYAVRTGHVAEIADAEALLSPGPRYNDGLKWLIAVIRRVQDGPARHSDNPGSHS